MKLLVTIPLCDYEPMSTRNWSRATTYFIVKACLSSFRRNTRVPLDLYILADRCSDRFVHMAEATLASFDPVVLDNSRVDPVLEHANLQEKGKHCANQFLKIIELSGGYDAVYVCEQDYLFKRDAVKHGLEAFREIPRVNVLSLFDHPNRHHLATEPELARQTFYEAGPTTWKSVSSTNGSAMWRGPFLEERKDWILNVLQGGGLDYGLTYGLYQEGELLLSPVESLIQHFALDGCNTSPTYGRSYLLTFVSRMYQLIASKKLRRKIGTLHDI